MIAAVAILAALLTLAGILTIRLARPPQAKITKGEQ